MNQKQFITMWCAIAAIALAGLTVIKNYGLLCPYGFTVWVFIVALVAGGLIYSFKEGSIQKKNAIQDIRDDLLKKKQSRTKKDDRGSDK
ncbi:MAG: hypothetical protein PHQ35_04985 [Phycisphaerae bacterium]|nr:hypothetical protein [Phycisphaerae bacterium]MDD5380928.1 hypothetical protein [Phycisphaerae bacterium]